MKGRDESLALASRLEYATIGWNLIEGVIAVVAARAAGSVALLGFGVDSFIESASAGVLVWRIAAERSSRSAEGIEGLERRATRLVALSLFLLALFVAADSAWTLWRGERPRASIVGIALNAVSIGVMVWLVRAKRRLAAELGSRALAGDSVQSWACLWLSVIVLAGLGLNAVFGWWWADPVAALGMSGFIGREAREAWAGEGDR